jgi:hypothetical protein
MHTTNVQNVQNGSGTQIISQQLATGNWQLATDNWQLATGRADTDKLTN